MNTVKTWQTVSSSSDDTFALGERLGSACKGGEIFLLVSDLGGGKTTLTKGLAKGLGSSDHVGSPTFTINRIYKCRDDLRLHHFDFYRLQEDAGIVAHELSEVIGDPKAIIVIEWGDAVSKVLPAERVELTMRRVKDNEDERSIDAEYSAKFAYLFEDQE